MKVYRYIQNGLLAVLLIGWGCLLTDCSDQTEIEPDRPDVQTGEPLRLAALTRAGEEGAEDDPMKGVNVNLFLKPQAGDILSGEVTYHGKDVTDEGEEGGELISGSTMLVKPGTDYQVFGYLPASAATGTVSVDGTTATMTFTDLDILSKEDLCIITGVKAGKLGDGQSVTPGNFDYHAPENTSGGYSLSLLAAHLYAGMEFKFMIDPAYNALRHVRLKKVELISTYNEKATVTVTLNMNNPSPMALPNYSTTSGSGATLDLWTSNSENGDELKESESQAIECKAYFAYACASTLSIKSYYDVYDMHGTMIREGQTAVNSLATVLSSLPGYKKNIKITVNPTYLYLLSDWDVDDPAFVVE